MLIKRKSADVQRGKLRAAMAGLSSGVMDRRTFLRRSGLVAGGVAAASALQIGSVRKADAAEGLGPASGTKIVKNICTHCSVGCTVKAEVANGVWVGQEPAWESPINRGSHCAKGASVRELTHGDRRIKYPMKLVDGQWQRITWDVAISEIGDKMMQIWPSPAPIPSICSARPNSPMRAPICSGSSPPSGAPTMSTTRRASATPPRLQVSRTPGATAR